MVGGSSRARATSCVTRCSASVSQKKSDDICVRLRKRASLSRSDSSACLPLQELADLAADDARRLQQALVGLAHLLAGEGQHADASCPRRSPGRRTRRGCPRPRPALRSRARGSRCTSAVQQRLAALPAPRRSGPRRRGRSGCASARRSARCRGRRSYQASCEAQQPSAVERGSSGRRRRPSASQIARITPRTPAAASSATASARATSCSSRSSSSPRFSSVIVAADAAVAGEAAVGVEHRLAADAHVAHAAVARLCATSAGRGTAGARRAAARCARQPPSHSSPLVPARLADQAAWRRSWSRPATLRPSRRVKRYSVSCSQYQSEDRSVRARKRASLSRTAARPRRG